MRAEDDDDSDNGSDEEDDDGVKRNADDGSYLRLTDWMLGTCLSIVR
jgi:hypothetical protein